MLLDKKGGERRLLSSFCFEFDCDMIGYNTWSHHCEILKQEAEDRKKIFWYVKTETWHNLFPNVSLCKVMYNLSMLLLTYCTNKETEAGEGVGVVK